MRLYFGQVEVLNFNLPGGEVAVNFCIPAFSESCSIVPSIDGTNLSASATSGYLAGESRCIDNTQGACSSTSGSCQESDFTNDFFVTFYGVFPKWKYSLKISFLVYKYYQELELKSSGQCQWSGWRTSELVGEAEVETTLQFQDSDLDKFCRVQKKFGIDSEGKLAENQNIALDSFFNAFPECEDYGIIIVPSSVKIEPAC